MVKINSNAAPVSFQGVTKIYGKDVVAVDNINLEIKSVNWSRCWALLDAVKLQLCG